jgi:hypothetical protein
LSPEEEVALKGFKGEVVEPQAITSITSKPALKGISASSNIYKLSGLYLAAKRQLSQLLKEKYLQGDLKQKYFLTRIEHDLTTQLIQDIKNVQPTPISIVINKALGLEDIKENDLNSALQEIFKNDFDVETQVLIEDIERVLLTIRYINQTPDELVRVVLTNFSNPIQKIIKGRRSGHQCFEINDEYDVQDILYVMLKSIFPNLRDEDAIPKVGGKSTKIDLILREQNILVEAKMIKAKDQNETHFIEELKVDFESYHQCQWLKKLFCFVYDPQKKTRDLSNFKDLNGIRNKNGHEYSVEVIVVN